MVLLNLKRFHTEGYTWWWGWLKYHPHRTLMFGELSQCEMILNCWITRSVSMAGIHHASYQSSWWEALMFCDIRRCNMILNCRIKRGDSTTGIDRAVHRSRLVVFQLMAISLQTTFYTENRVLSSFQVIASLLSGKWYWIFGSDPIRLLTRGRGWY